ncbi:clotting factor G beta subunit-like [Brevipalpus obovatus]|uniref:clotting factor G beta subunit-like n=1 Tax=Brevipalpus obovatus TaxID=246614 RepID=UPI003D9F4866
MTILIHFLLVLTWIFASSGENCDCGLRLQSRIFHGHTARAHKYPWMANIYVNFEPEPFSDEEDGDLDDDEEDWSEPTTRCGGSLLDNQHILTAAHCVIEQGDQPVPINTISVYLGRHQSPKDGEAGSYNVSHVFAHPSYHFGSLAYDMAILRLDKPVTYSTYVSPICILDDSVSLEELSERYAVAGWGITGPQTTAAEYLQETHVDYVDREECNELSKLYMSQKLHMSINSIPDDLQAVKSTHICALNRKTGADACDEDSGGPLMYQNPKNSRWYVTGVVSGSYDVCGVSPYVVGLYTDISKFYKLIKEKVPGACSPAM